MPSSVCGSGGRCGTKTQEQRERDEEGGGVDVEDDRGAERAISTPATAGPRSDVARRAPSTSAVACATSARRRRRAPAGSAAAPRSTAPGRPRRAETSTSSSGKLSQPSSWRSGIDAIKRRARERRETSIVRRAPSRAISAPLGIPRSATGASSTASTTLIRAGEPVVDEHEPRQREERHLRAERRDDLRREQRRDPASPEQAHAAPPASRRRRRPRAGDDARDGDQRPSRRSARPRRRRAPAAAPNASSTGPTPKTPSGCASPKTIICTVRTLGRSGGGTRSVISEWIGGLTIPFATPGEPEREGREPARTGT